MNRPSASWFIIVLSTIFKGLAIVSIVQATFHVGLRSVFASALSAYREAIHPLLDHIYLPVFRGPLTETEKDLVSLFLLVVTSIIAVWMQYWTQRPDDLALRRLSRLHTPSTIIMLIALTPVALILFGFTDFLDHQAKALISFFPSKFFFDFGMSSSLLLGSLWILFIVTAYLLTLVGPKPRAEGDRLYGGPLQQYNPLGFYILTAVLGAAAFFLIDAFS